MTSLRLKYTILILELLVCRRQAYNMSDTVVTTRNGKVQGKVIDLKQKDAKRVYSYRNIPFAKPPVGELRFMSPQPAESWKGVRDGTTPGHNPMNASTFNEAMFKYVPQIESDDPEQIFDEDCLHVSVYTPHPQKSKNLPVMVWIYGGGFMAGSERFYEGSVLAAMNDVVVVIPNYRVGILGFLALGPSSICPGNQGILDQQLALTWVQDNIGVFGGDENNVTIFGESAGGASVNHHMISPLSHGLFHKAISHSGQSVAPGGFNSQAINRQCNEKLATYLDVKENNDVKLIKILQKTPVEELLKAESENHLHFCTVVDNKVLIKSPWQCLKDKYFYKVPYIIGVNRSEGHGILSQLLAPNFSEGIREEELKDTIMIQLTDEGLSKCKEYYSKKDDNDVKRYSKMSGNIITDGFFVTPAVNTATTYADEGCKIFFYYGDFRLKMFRDAEYGGNIGKKVDWCECDHCDEISMTFGMPFTHLKMKHGVKFTEDEAELSRKFMTYLTNFAKTGDPNKGKNVDVHWPEYKEDKKHLVLATPLSHGENLCPKVVDFWNEEMLPHTIT